ncbi:hypothetical protein BDW02DRAFT_288750 [Decorospora gaudefroyi]|uniref:Uncharacterized protein n=1 Tax=Decorospora gaudefroyi TaxID=184978 RepID=A0A6A5KIL4_9PLEO|nr:hypothetical protein BDW02DRAFT_288750 [Decorospora gaudefroyi]
MPAARSSFWRRSFVYRFCGRRSRSSLPSLCCWLRRPLYCPSPRAYPPSRPKKNTGQLLLTTTPQHPRPTLITSLNRSSRTAMQRV